MANTQDADIQSAFMQKLGTLSNSPTLRVALENENFSPNTDEIWLKPNMLPVRTRTVELGDNGQNEKGGIFQITVYAPKNTGPGAGLAVVGKLLDLFKRGTSLSYGSVVGIRLLAPYRGPGIPEDAWWGVPVSVPWFTFTSNDGS